MTGLFRGDDFVERELRAGRPRPDDELVRQIEGRVQLMRRTSERRTAEHAFRFALPAAFTVTVVGGLAAVGGASYAASSVTSAARTVSHAFTPASTDHLVKASWNSGCDQYKPGYGWGDHNHNHPGPPVITPPPQHGGGGGNSGGGGGYGGGGGNSGGGGGNSGGGGGYGGGGGNSGGGGGNSGGGGGNSGGGGGNSGGGGGYGGGGGNSGGGHGYSPLKPGFFGTTAIISTTITLDEQADLTITIVIKTNGVKLPIAPMESLIGQKSNFRRATNLAPTAASNTLAVAAKSVKYRVLVPRTIPLKIAIPSSVLHKGVGYAIKVTARAPNGQASTIQIPVAG